VQEATAKIVLTLFDKALLILTLHNGMFRSPPFVFDTPP